MNSDDILWNPRLLHHLVRERRFEEDKFIFVDVGMRAGIPQHWTMLKDQLHVIGFEPDVTECQRLNSLRTEWTQVCFPYALDSTARTRPLYRRSHNHAADGVYRWTWWWERFGIASVEETRQFRPYAKKKYLSGLRNKSQIDTITYAEFSKLKDLPNPDFFKIDVEGAELDVLRGAESFLKSDGVVGVEIEAQFIPIQDCPLFIDVYNYLVAQGFYLASLSPFRVARRVLPLPLLWDHRDHRGKPLMHGFTTRGQIGSADALFIRDLIADNFVPAPGDRRALLRILKAAAMFELYNMPDCAAELLLYYREALSEVVDINSCLDQLVPEESAISGAGSYETYLDIYRRRNGRLMPIGSSSATVATAKASDDQLMTIEGRQSLLPLDLGGGEALASANNDGSPNRAFDGNPESFWVSAERGAQVKGTSWIGYAFAAPCEVREILIEQSTGRHYRQDTVAVEKSLDGGETWQAAVTGPVRLIGKIARIELPAGAPAPLWRLVAAGDNATDLEDAWTVTDVKFFGEANLAPLPLEGGEALASAGNGGAPDRAFDGDPESFWISVERGREVQGQSWIGYRFAEPRKVRWIRIEQSTRSHFRQDAVRVEKSADGGETWVPTVAEPVRLVGQRGWIDLPNGTPAELWRLAAAGDNTADPEDAWTVIDVRFFGEADSAGTPEAPLEAAIQAQANITNGIHSNVRADGGPHPVSDEDGSEAKLIQEYEARIAALERLVGRQALELELLKGR